MTLMEQLAAEKDVPVEALDQVFDIGLKFYREQRIELLLTEHSAYLHRLEGRVSDAANALRAGEAKELPTLADLVELALEA